MARSKVLDRNIRPRPESSSSSSAGDDELNSSELGGSSPSVLSTGDADGSLQNDHFGQDRPRSAPRRKHDSRRRESNAAYDMVEEEPYEDALRHVSFGELSRAQTSLAQQGALDDASGRKRKRRNVSDGSESKGVAAEDDEKIEVLRERLRELKELKALRAMNATTKAQLNSTRSDDMPFYSQSAPDHERASLADSGETVSDSSSESDALTTSSKPPSTSKNNKITGHRSSRQAPPTESSSRPVPRRRPSAQPLRKHRDPRFDISRTSTSRPAHGNAAMIEASDFNLRSATRSRYAFLNSYAASELALKKKHLSTLHSQDPERAALAREIGSIESRNRARADAEHEREIIRKLRKEERKKVEAGKKPFHLKTAERRKAVAIEKFAAMKKGDREKAMSKRRKRVSGNQMKSLPGSRRL